MRPGESAAFGRRLRFNDLGCLSQRHRSRFPELRELNGTVGEIDNKADWTVDGCPCGKWRFSCFLLSLFLWRRWGLCSLPSTIDPFDILLTPSEPACAILRIVILISHDDCYAIVSS